MHSNTFGVHSIFNQSCTKSLRLCSFSAAFTRASMLSMYCLTRTGLSFPPDWHMHCPTSSCFALSSPFCDLCRSSGNLLIISRTAIGSGIHLRRPMFLMTSYGVPPCSKMISATFLPILAFITLSLIRSNTCKTFWIFSFSIGFLIFAYVICVGLHLVLS